MTSPHTHRLCPGPTPPGRPPVLASFPRQSPQLQTLPSSKLPPRALPYSSREPQPPPTNPPAPPSRPPIPAAPGRSLAPIASDSAEGHGSVPMAPGASLPASRGLRVTQPTTQPAQTRAWAPADPGGPSRGRSCPILRRPRGPPSAWCSGCQGRAEALTPDTFSSGLCLSITVRRPLPSLQAPAALSWPLRLRGVSGSPPSPPRAWLP